MGRVIGRLSARARKERTVRTWVGMDSPLSPGEYASAEYSHHHERKIILHTAKNSIFLAFGSDVLMWRILDAIQR
jgi:hypothetical protein